jgi:hypothetical protein
MNVTVADTDAVKEIDKMDSERAKIACNGMEAACDVFGITGLNKEMGRSKRTCKRCRSIGNKAKSCTEHRIRAKTARSLDRREARTTEDEIAAFMESTDVNLR